MAAGRDLPVSPEEAAALFDDLKELPVLLLAVSGGPDSTALMWLAARWRAGLKRGPKLVAVTINHGLRPEAADEARAVARLARKVGVPHRTLRWTGKKPETGLQEAARAARYRLLAKAAQKVRASAILTAHTLDDQAETVLIRLVRGSGLTGLAGMRRTRPVAESGNGVMLARPLLSVPKSRLVATLRAENIPFAEDPSNQDPRFTRARLRGLGPTLTKEGLDARRLAVLARRLARADAALKEAADRAFDDLVKREQNGQLVLPAPEFMALPQEIGLRLLGRAMMETGDDSRIKLGKLEGLLAALTTANPENARFRRSLAGALVTLNRSYLTVERAPPRRSRTLTTGSSVPRRQPKKG